MIEKINEKNVWESVRECGLPVVLYGMGNGADMVMDTLDEIGVPVADIFASDEFVRGHSFRGHKVLKYSEVCEKYDDFCIVLCFAVHDEPTLRRIRQMSEKHLLFAPNVPIVNDGNFTREYIAANDEKFDKAYGLLADELSRKIYMNVLNFKVSGKTEYLFHCQTEKEEAYKNCLTINQNEIFMDLGAYDGDTVREFLTACDGKYRKIYALEADEKNFKKLIANTADIDRLEAFNLAAWDKKETLAFEKKKGRNSKLSAAGTISIQSDSVDNILSGREITVLKMDIEGSEERALDGAAQTIKKYAPKLYVCGYHRNSDMFALPIKIHSLNSEYKIRFRHHPYIPAWESNFYAGIE